MIAVPDVPPSPSALFEPLPKVAQVNTPLRRLALFCLLALTIPSLASAQPSSVRPLVPAPRGEQANVARVSVPPTPMRGIRDRAELEAFLDGVMIANLRDKHVAGATVAVVKDGAVFFTKGYGYSDVAARAPVD